jgi:hypothetical protein
MNGTPGGILTLAAKPAQKAGESAVRKLLIPLSGNSKNRIAHKELFVDYVLEDLRLLNLTEPPLTEILLS